MAARLWQVLRVAGCKHASRHSPCAVQGSHHRQLGTVVVGCVESEKHGLVVGLFLPVIMVRKAEAAHTVAPIPGKSAKERSANVLINISIYDMIPPGHLAPCPSRQTSVHDESKHLQIRSHNQSSDTL